MSAGGRSDKLELRKRPLTAAEKQRNYRERLKQSPERYAVFRRKEAERQRERTKNRKQTEEQIEYQRMKWRERVTKHRQKKKMEAMMREKQRQEAVNVLEVPGNCNSTREGAMTYVKVKQETDSGDVFPEESSSEALINDSASVKCVESKEGIKESCDTLMTVEGSEGYYSSAEVKLECNTVKVNEMQHSSFDGRSYPTQLKTETSSSLRMSPAVDIRSVVSTGKPQDCLHGNSARMQDGKVHTQKRRPMTAAERQRKHRAKLKQRKIDQQNATISDSSYISTNENGELIVLKTTDSQHGTVQESGYSRESCADPSNRLKVGPAIARNIEASFDQSESCFPVTSELLPDRRVQTPKKKKPMTAAERQRKYRERLKQRRMDQQEEGNSVANSLKSPSNVLQENSSTSENINVQPESCQETTNHSSTDMEIKSHLAETNDAQHVCLQEAGYQGEFPTVVSSRLIVGPLTPDHSLINRGQDQDCLPDVLGRLCDQKICMRKRRRPMTAAERQRKYREKLKQRKVQEQEASVLKTTAVQHGSVQEIVFPGESFAHPSRRRTVGLSTDNHCQANLQQTQECLPVSSERMQDKVHTQEKRIPVTPAERQRKYREKLKQREMDACRNMSDVEVKTEVTIICESFQQGDFPVESIADESSRLELDPIMVTQSLTSIEHAQDYLPANATTLQNGICHTPNKRTPLTPAERQRKYREKLKQKKLLEQRANMSYSSKSSEVITGSNSEETDDVQVGSFQGEDYPRDFCAEPNIEPRVHPEIIPVDHVVGSTGDHLPMVSAVMLNGKSHTRNRRPLTAAERQRKYREKLKETGKWEEYKLRDAQRRRQMHQQRKFTLSEEVVAHCRKVAREKKRVYRRRRKGERRRSEKYLSTENSNSKLLLLQRETFNQAECQSSVKSSNVRKMGVHCSLSKGQKVLTEEQIAQRRLKGRERMRKFRLRQKEQAMRSAMCLSIVERDDIEDDQPKILKVWSLKEEAGNSGAADSGRIETLSNWSDWQRRREQIYSDLLEKNSPSQSSIIPHSSIPTNDESTVTLNTGRLENLTSDPNITTMSKGNIAHPALADFSSTSGGKSLKQTGHDQLDGTQSLEGKNSGLKALTAAEKQRQYRERLRQNPEKWAAYKQKAAERYWTKKACMTMAEVDRKRMYNMLRTRKWRAKKKERERLWASFNEIALGNNIDDGKKGKDGSGQISQYRTLSNLEKLERMRQSNKERQRRYRARKRDEEQKAHKILEDAERIRKLNRERQRRCRARKRGRINQIGNTPPEGIVGENYHVNEDNKLIIKEEDDTIGSVNEENHQGDNPGDLRGACEAKIDSSSQFRIDARLKSSKTKENVPAANILQNVDPRKCRRPRKSDQNVGQSVIEVISEYGGGLPTVLKRGQHGQENFALSNQDAGDYYLNTQVSIQSECPSEVVVSSAGNIPMVVKAVEVSSQLHAGQEDIPQVIPCDPPPEANFDWGVLEMTNFSQIFQGADSLKSIEDASDIKEEEEESGCVLGSARRKAFFPTKHSTAACSMDVHPHMS